MVTNSKDLIMLTQNDGAILYLSPSCKEILGYEPSELVRAAPWVVHPEDSERIQKIFHDALTTQLSGTTEYRIITKQGQTKWVSHSFSQIIEKGTIKQVVSNVKDISEAKQAQVKLAESEEHFRLAVKNSPIMMAILNSKLEYIWHHNTRFLSEENFTGRVFGTILPIDDVENLRRSLYKVMETGCPLRREVTIQFKDRTFVLDAIFEPYKDEQGKNVGISFAAYDITERKQMENELKTYVDRWNFALEEAGYGVWDLNPVTNEVFYSKNWKKILGYEEDEFEEPNGSWETRIHPDDKAAFEAKKQKLYNQEISCFLSEHRLKCKDGTYKWMSARAQVMSWSPIGKPLRVIGTHTDINERKLAEAALLESEAKFSAAFYSNGSALSITGLTDGLIIEVNDAFLKMLGYTREEIVGKTILEIAFYVDTKDREEIVELVQKNQPVINRELKGRKKDGTEITVLFSTKNIDIEGKSHLLTSFIDISALKRTEQALFLRQKELETFIGLAPDAITIFDLTGKIVDCNEMAWRLFGYSREEVIGRHAFDFISENDRDKFNQNLYCSLQKNQVTDIIKGKRKNGEEFSLEGSVKAVFDETDKPTAFISITRDITRKTIEEQKIIELLHESEQRAAHLRELLSVSQMVLRNNDIETILEHILNAFGKIVPTESGIIFLTPTQVTHEVVALFNRNGIVSCRTAIPNDLLQTCQEVCSDDKAAYFNDLPNSKFHSLEKMPHISPKNAAFIPLKIKEKVGGYIVLGNKKKDFDDNEMLLGTLLAEFAQIALENNAAFEAIANSEMQIRAITESARDAIVMINAGGDVTFWSPAAEQMFGYSSDEVCGRDFHKMFSTNENDEDSEKAFEKFQRVLLSAGKTLEVFGRTKSGKTFPAEVSLSQVQQGETTSVVGIIRDVTQRKKDHEERDSAFAKAEQLLEKLGVVGGFVRHDIRNKLTVITNTVYLSKKFANNNQQMLKYLDHISSAAQSIVRILEFSRTYQSIGDVGFSWVNLDKTVKEAQEWFSDFKGVQIESQEMGFEVLADSTLIEVFHNLIDNSLKYGKSLTKIKLHAIQQDNGGLNIIYEDNGGGIDAAIKPYLFQKGAGNGTGLGLYLTKRICEVYGWGIQENGQAGTGVKFTIDIPQKQARPIMYDA